jgi:SAM-dependent methyltransferase
MNEAYADAADPVSLREEAGQVETARRALRHIGRLVQTGKLADIGCWTGSLVAAASELGWDACGVDPSRWAVKRANERKLRVWQGDFRDPLLASETYRAVAMCDVLEHLPDPRAAVDVVANLVEEGGVLYLTVPDAGSAVARLLGRRWWSILPMHLQYFTRASMRRLLEERHFEVRHISSHTKVFTGRYYADRLGGYSPLIARLVSTTLEASGLSSRLVSPNFHDRMEVLAVRRRLSP